MFDTVEGAHSDEVRSVGSGSGDGSRGGNRMLPPLLGDFDVHRFKSAILEVKFSTVNISCQTLLYIFDLFVQVVEELRMRRVYQSLRSHGQDML